MPLFQMDKNLNIRGVNTNKLPTIRWKLYAYFPHMCKILHAFFQPDVTISLLQALRKY